MLATPGLEDLLADEPETPGLADLLDDEVPRDQPEEEAAEELQRMMCALDAEAMRRSFAEFFAAGWHVIRGSEQLDLAPHLEGYLAHAQACAEDWLVANGRVTVASHDEAGKELVARVDARWREAGLERIHGRLLAQNHVVNGPPGSCKSIPYMVFLPLWIWLWDPTASFGCLSANDDNVQRDARESREVYSSSWYRETFGITAEIRDDADAIGRWVTTAGGSRSSRTLEQGITGKHVDIALIDDPDEAKKVWHKAKRDSRQRQLAALSNRFNHMSRFLRIMIQQRLHPEDATGEAVAKSLWSPKRRSGWAWFCVPLTQGRQPEKASIATVYGWKDQRKKGERLQPDRYTDESLETQRDDLGTHGVEAQYEQNPTSLDGGMFPRSGARFFVLQGTNPLELRARPDGCLSRDEQPALIVPSRANGMPDFDALMVSVDPSNGSESEEASATGCGVFGIWGSRECLLDDLTQVTAPERIYEVVKEAVVRATDFGDVDKVLVELKAAGPAVVNELQKALSSGELRDRRGEKIDVEVVPIKVGGKEGDKETRAVSLVPAWQRGDFLFLDGAPWLYARKGDDGVIADVCGFPRIKRKDRVDMISQLHNYIRANDDELSSARAMNRW